MRDLTTLLQFPPVAYKRIVSSKFFSIAETGVIMVARAALTFLAFTLLLASSPVAALAQARSATEPLEPPPASQEVTDNSTTSNPGPAQEALRVSSHYNALLAPLAMSPLPGEGLSLLGETAPPTPFPQSQGSGTGLGFMIGGAAAFVGGLLIGGTGGSLIAAGGVALGVWGVIIYF